MSFFSNLWSRLNVYAAKKVAAQQVQAPILVPMPVATPIQYVPAYQPPLQPPVTIQPVPVQVAINQPVALAVPVVTAQPVVSAPASPLAIPDIAGQAGSVHPIPSLN